jgi:hypothetical protein
MIHDHHTPKNTIMSILINIPLLKILSLVGIFKCESENWVWTQGFGSSAAKLSVVVSAAPLLAVGLNQW